jgi:hypothetical protein
LSKTGLDYDVYREHFERDLRDILEDNLKEDHAECVARTLAHDYARNKPDAVNKVNNIFDRAGLHMDELLESAQAQKAEELAQEYGRHEPSAAKLIHELLAGAGKSLEVLIIRGLPETSGIGVIGPNIRKQRMTARESDINACSAVGRPEMAGQSRSLLGGPGN